MSIALDVTKGTLGKLLASENIRIEHRQVNGPAFDVKTRTLILPIWKDVNSDLYDLMIGHEVGHALFTPTEGWESKLVERGNKFKIFLNIVEDARIEKKMKRKYPGLRKPMYGGYTQLVDRGFFGTTIPEMKFLPFVDRLNVFFKLGARASVIFSDTEQEFIDRVENAETWEEVVDLAEELYEISEKEKEDSHNDSSDDSDGAGASEGESQETQQSMPTDNPDSQFDNDDSSNDDVDENQIPSEKPSEATQNILRDWKENDDIASITQESFYNNEQKLIDLNAYDSKYLYFPKLDVKDWTVDAKTVHSNMIFYHALEARREDVYTEFMNANKKYISYLVKEFELRRNAKQFAKAKTSKTGEIDMSKIWKYKITEDIFRQSTIVPNGKNHGMLMLVDLSSSMYENIEGTLQQVISLALFCKKTNIPFEVHGFIDNGFFKSSKDITSRNDLSENTLFLKNEYFRLMQLLHHNMKAYEFTHAIKNLLLLSKAYSTFGAHMVPASIQLGGTPLNEAVVVLRYVAENFKKNTGIEILNTIILTDGDASYSLNYYEGVDLKSVGSTANVIVEDRETRIQEKIGYRNTQTLHLLNMYKKITNSRVIGFYIMNGGDHKRTVQSMAYRGSSFVTGNNTFDYYEFDKKYSEIFPKNKFMPINMMGYDVFYMVAGDKLKIENTDMNSMLKNKNVTKTSILTAFKKMQNNKMISRVFLNQFIQKIS